MSQLKQFSTTTEEVRDLGPDTDDLDQILGLGEMMATNRPDIIVYVDGPALQKWVPA